MPNVKQHFSTWADFNTTQEMTTGLALRLRKGFLRATKPRVMNGIRNNPYGPTFSNWTIEQLVESFNEDQLKPPTVNYARQQFRAALMDAFLKTEFDKSSFLTDNSMSMSHQIAIDNGKIIKLTNNWVTA